MSILFIVSVIKAVKQHRVSRKCYVLIINRSVGDILTCVMAFVNIAYVLIKDEPNKDMVHVFDNFFIASFWSGMISYVSLSVLKLYAVARPFDYRKTITMKRCIYLVIASWVIFLVVLSYALGVTAITKIPFLHEWSGCRLETCLRRMYRIRNAIAVGIYCFTIICFVLTVIYLNRARRFVHSFHKNKENAVKPKILRNRFPLWKLALNVATFAGFNLFYIGWIVTLLIVAASDACFFQRNYPLMMQTLGLVRLCLLARIIVDPIMSFITDFQIKKSFLSLFGVHGTVQPYDSRRPFRKEISEEISSDYEVRTKPSSTTMEDRVTIKTDLTKSVDKNPELSPL
uniref:G-protein coupled receptors family 1 profile domain-containing protein n=1 Tax=Panagrolaimus davidi TaxID=227884 RepID=A0A914PYA2_9BILA